MDSLNLLVEYGSDLSKKNNDGLTSYDEMCRHDNLEIFECVFEFAKKAPRNMKDVKF